MILVYMLKVELPTQQPLNKEENYGNNKRDTDW